MTHFVALPLLGTAIALAWATHYVTAYAEPHVYNDKTERWVLLLCAFAYVISAIPVVLLPLDVASLTSTTDGCDDVRASSDQKPMLEWFGAWYPLYMAILATGYGLNDFARCYIDSGGYSMRRRTLLALKELQLFYGVFFLAVLGLLVLLVSYLGAWHALNASFWSLLFDVLVVAVNLYGICIFVMLFAHSFSEIPKRLVYLRDFDARQRLREHKVGTAYLELSAACDAYVLQLRKLLEKGGRLREAGRQGRLYALGVRERRELTRDELHEIFQLLRKMLDDVWRTESVVASCDTLMVRTGRLAPKIAGAPSEAEWLGLHERGADDEGAPYILRRSRSSSFATSSSLGLLGATVERWSREAGVAAQRLLDASGASTKLGHWRRLEDEECAATCAQTSADAETCLDAAARSTATIDGVAGGHGTSTAGAAPPLPGEGESIGQLPPPSASPPPPQQEQRNGHGRAAAARPRAGLGVEEVGVKLEDFESLHQGLREGCFRWRRANVLYRTAVDAAMSGSVMKDRAELQGYGDELSHRSRARDSSYPSSDEYAPRSSQPTPAISVGMGWIARKLSETTPRALRLQLKALEYLRVGFLLSFLVVALLIMISEATLSAFFFLPLPSGDAEPGERQPLPSLRTPLSLLLMPAHDVPAGAYSLLVIGLMLLITCAWSLRHSQIEFKKLGFNFRMDAPAATPTGSLAMHSAYMCKVSIVLTYNVNLLLLGPDVHGWHTPQTYFYCLMASKSRLVVAGQDYYLLLFPGLLCGLCMLWYCDCMRWCRRVDSADADSNTRELGRGKVEKGVKVGREIVRRLKRRAPGDRAHVSRALSSESGASSLRKDAPPPVLNSPSESRRLSVLPPTPVGAVDLVASEGERVGNGAAANGSADPAGPSDDRDVGIVVLGAASIDDAPAEGAGAACAEDAAVGVPAGALADQSDEYELQT